MEMKMNWILKNFFESIANIADKGFEYLSTALNTLFLNAANLGDLDNFINETERYTAILSFLVLGIVIMKRIFATYILETDGDPDSDPIDIIMQASLAIALISNNVIIFRELLSAAKIMGDEVLTALSEIKLDSVIKNLKGAIPQECTNISNGFTAVFILAFGIGAFVLCIKGGIRGAELCLMKILFPLFCCDLLTTRRERFNAFLTSYLVTIFGYILQILCFRFSCRFASKYIGLDGIEQILFAFAFLYLAIKAPKWLDKFVYSTGIGQSIGGGARSAAFMLPSLMRGMKG